VADSSNGPNKEPDFAALRARCLRFISPNPVGALARQFTLGGGQRPSALARLSGAISRLSAEVESDSSEPATKAAVFDLLLDAVERLERRNVNEGWASFNDARRTSYSGADADRRRVLGASVRAEATAKLTGWRQNAALEILGKPSAEPPTVAQLREAQAHLDEQSSNVFRRIDLYSSVLRYVLVGLAVLLAVMFVVVDRTWLPALEGTSLDNVRSLTGIVLLGALGSFLSVALTRANPHEENLPAMIQSRLVDVLRPVVGAASAVAFVLFIESGMQSALESDGSKIYVWALLAGFSERLLRRTLESAAASASATPPSTDSIPD